MFATSETAALIVNMTAATHDQRLTRAYRDGRDRTAGHWMDALKEATIISESEFTEIEAAYWDGRQDSDEIDEFERSEAHEASLELEVVIEGE